MRFSVGEEVVCIKKGAWVPAEEGAGTREDPITNNIYVVDNPESEIYGGETYITLVGFYLTGFNEEHFAPLSSLYNEEIAAVMEYRRTISPVALPLEYKWKD